jgi:hypothetical protein
MKGFLLGLANANGLPHFLWISAAGKGVFDRNPVGGCGIGLCPPPIT